jgi:Bacterial regulatory proteins, tetR family
VVGDLPVAYSKVLLIAQIRIRAEQRVQRFLDAAQAIVTEKGNTDFTVQEVVDRSRQSLRSFYQHFDGKHELMRAAALTMETVMFIAQSSGVSGSGGGTARTRSTPTKSGTSAPGASPSPDPARRAPSHSARQPGSVPRDLTAGFVAIFP